MVAFLKAYQEKWLIDIEKAQDDDEIRSTCDLILCDDTGGTDELTILLAKELLLRLSV